jgi:hypothetical protein
VKGVTILLFYSALRLGGNLVGPENIFLKSQKKVILSG